MQIPPQILLRVVVITSAYDRLLRSCWTLGGNKQDEHDVRKSFVFLLEKKACSGTRPLKRGTSLSKRRPAEKGTSSPGIHDLLTGNLLIKRRFDL
jgi:hypothetical protein